MAKTTLSMFVGSALILLGSAGAAYAQTGATRAGADFADRGAQARDAYSLNQNQAPTVLELDGNSRWGVKLELKEPVTREMRLKDVEAGAYYRFTPALRVGGAVGLADKDPPASPAAAPKDSGEVTPRVRLGAIFKF